MTIFCRACGAQLDDGAAFCGSCGTAVAVAPAAPPEPAPAPPPPPPAPAPSLAKPDAAPIPPVSPPAPAYAPPPPHYPPAPPPPAATSATPWIIVAILAVGIALAAVFYATRTGSDSEEAEADTSAATAGAAEEAAAATAAPTPVGPVVTKFVSGPANIRTMPTAQAGTGSSVVGTLRAGTQVQGQMVVGPGNAYWLQLTDGRGFVSAINLSDGPAAPVVPAPAAQGQVRAPVDNGVYCAVATQTGNLRVRATPAGRIVGGMPRGARFQMYGQAVLASGYYWVQIQPADYRYPGGWVASEHIRC